MTKTELDNFISAKMAEHGANFVQSYNRGEFQIESPDKPITNAEFQTLTISMKLAFMDALESLGLLD